MAKQTYFKDGEKLSAKEKRLIDLKRNFIEQATGVYLSDASIGVSDVICSVNTNHVDNRWFRYMQRAGRPLPSYTSDEYKKELLK